MTQDNSRPMGNTPVTDAAAVDAPTPAPDGSNDTASNADLRIGEKHGGGAMYDQDHDRSERQQGIENPGSDELNENNEELVDKNPSRVGGEDVEVTLEEENDEDDFDDEDEADDDAEAYQDGVTEAQGGRAFNPAE